jgi:hypothetical protein
MSENIDVAVAVDGLAAETAAYLGRFRRSQKGNLVLRGWVTDTGAEGQPSAPFQLVVFTSQGDHGPLDKWTWGIVIDPPPANRVGDKEVMEYSNDNYPDANAAALAARAQLQAGGLVMSDEAPALVGVRMRIKAAAKRRQNDGRWD